MSFRRVFCGANAALWLIWPGFGCSASSMSEQPGTDVGGESAADTGTAPTMATIGVSGTAGADHDGTHFQARGARKLASFVAKALQAHNIAWVDLR